MVVCLKVNLTEIVECERIFYHLWYYWNDFATGLTADEHKKACTTVASQLIKTCCCK